VVAVVEIVGLDRLPATKSGNAMESFRLYLAGFTEDGEFFSRIGKYAYGLALECGDEAALSRRLEILKQDIRFLYMASYPGLEISARVTVRRIADAPRRASVRRGGRNSDGPKLTDANT
jgi:hypothetical protein